jgi:hypothetical protein
MAPAHDRVVAALTGGAGTISASLRASARERRGDLAAVLRRPDAELLSQAAPWLGLLIGAFLITDAYSWAASHATGTQQFTLFWLGLFVYTIPVAFRLGRATISRNEQLLLATVTALFFFLPKVLRSPSGPIYADELGHWRQTEVLYRSGHLFEANPFITVASGYPALHTLTDVLRTYSGLSTWGAGVAIIAVCLCLDVLGVYHLVERLVGERMPRAASFAALIYACASGFMFFDSQYAYETLGLPLLIWVLVALAHLLHRQTPSRARAAWATIAATLAAALVITHHLTAIVLCIILTIASIAALAQRRQRRGSPTRELRDILVFTSGTIAATVIWALLAVPKLVHYLSPHITGGISQLAGILRQQQGSRQLFALSTSPPYEHRAAFVAPVVAAGFVLLGLLTLLLVRRQRIPPLLVALIVLGLAYFPSVPFILTTSGAEGARRSWDFSYIGVALLAGVAFDMMRRAVHPWRIPAWAWRVFAPIVVSLAVAMILLGNVSAGLNVEYRFPGPYVYGSDTRSLTAESRGAVAWFGETQGTGQRIVADRQDAIAFGSLGLNWIERAYGGLPLWQFYFQPQRPDSGVFRNIRQLKDHYLIVDKRISRFLPRTGVYMVGDEPGAHEHVSPPPAAAIAKYSVTPWTNRIYASTDLEILRFDTRAVGLCTDQAPEPGTSFARCPGTP